MEIWRKRRPFPPKSPETSESISRKELVSGSTNPCSNAIELKSLEVKKFLSNISNLKKSGTTTPSSQKEGPEIFDSGNSRGPANPAPLITKGAAGEFRLFTESALIGAFEPSLLHPPKRGKSYNNDVALPLYESSMRSYAGTQRKGIRGEHPEAKNVHEHVAQALQAPFFLAQSTPLPPSTRRDVLFLARSCPRAVTAFWKRQLSLGKFGRQPEGGGGRLGGPPPP